MFGLGGSEFVVVFMFFSAIAFFIIPFIVNYKLAQSRGKSVALMILLTLIFSWIVTLVLAFIPALEQHRS